MRRHVVRVKAVVNPQWRRHLLLSLRLGLLLSLHGRNRSVNIGIATIAPTAINLLGSRGGVLLMSRRAHLGNGGDILGSLLNSRRRGPLKRVNRSLLISEGRVKRLVRGDTG